MAPNPVANETNTDKPIGYYTLRGFLDAEYGVIIGVSFLVVADQLVKLRQFPSTWYIKYPHNIGGFFAEIINDKTLHNECGTLLYLLVLFIMLVDQYYRARVITFHYPFHSTNCFTLEVLQGFLFGLAFRLIQANSTLMWTAVGLAFFLGAAWANAVERESYCWENYPAEPNFRADPQQDIHWPVFKARLTYMRFSNLLFGNLMIGINGVIILTDFSKQYYAHYAVLFLVCYLVCETARFWAETRIIVKFGRENDRYYMLGVLRTIAWIPRNVQMFLRHLAKRNL